MKKVSVIVPCYNQANYLEETLQSVLNQTYPQWECIIVNDGSTDDSERIALNFCQVDTRFRYIYKSNSGVANARNEGVNNATGDLILPLDGDDMIAKEFLSKAVEIFESSSDMTLVYCKANFFGEECGEWKLEDYSYEKLVYRNMIFCTAMYKKSDFYKTSGYNSNMIYGLEDWDFWLSLLNEKSKVKCINETLFYYRIRKGSRNSILNDLHFEESGRQIYLNHKHLYEKYLNPARDARRFERIEAELLCQREKTRKYKKIFKYMVMVCVILFLLLLLLIWRFVIIF